MVNNNGKQLVNNESFPIDYHEPQTHNLQTMRNLEMLGAKRPTPEVAGSNPAPRIELTSIRANGTNSSLATPQKQIVYHEQNGNGKQSTANANALFYAILNEGVQP
jgi:hypothetical protein